MDDLGPLAMIQKLTEVYIWSGGVQDLSSLLEAESLPPGLVRISLSSNPLTEEAQTVQIPALRSLGIEIGF